MGEKVYNGMGSCNNVLHVEEDKDEEVEGSDVEESRNEELNETAKEETNAIVSHVDQEIRKVADITEDEDEDERESDPDPNLVMKRAVVMMQKLREVECAVQNLVLTSPVRVTRGKFKKFVKENDFTPAVC